ncbi:MAG: hypothetical protein WC942_06080 [Clostridia bacterium]|jgi:hypothetical protein
MNQEINSVLQFQRQKDFSGLAETNMLANVYQTAPEQVEAVLAQSMGHQGLNVFEYLTGGTGAVKEIEGNRYEWDIYTKDEEITTVLKQSPDYVTAASKPGYSGTSFRVILDKPWYETNDILVADDTDIRIKLVDDGISDGASVIYTAVMHSPAGFESFCPVEFLAPGARWSKDYNLVSEISLKGSGDVYHTPYKMRNILGIYRKTIRSTRSAANFPMVMSLPNPENPEEKVKIWTRYQELVAIQNWYKELDRVAMYSTFNDTPEKQVIDMGGDGRPAYEGAGIREQISKANIRYYSGDITYALIDDFFTMLSYKVTEWGGNAEFVLLTGKQGKKKFHEAIKDEVNERNITLNSADFMTFNGNNITLKGYYDTVILQCGVKVTVKEFPPYDDLTRNRKTHPVTGYPLESYRYTVVNMGSKNGKANIRKVVNKNGKNAMWHVCGSYSPTDGLATGNTMRSTGFDGYDTHWLTEIGTQIQDSTTCGEIILRVG